jgi:hypothetical protein
MWNGSIGADADCGNEGYGREQAQRIHGVHHGAHHGARMRS